MYEAIKFKRTLPVHESVTKEYSSEIGTTSCKAGCHVIRK
jgi:hypothetical protein